MCSLTDGFFGAGILVHGTWINAVEEPQCECCVLGKVLKSAVVTVTPNVCIIMAQSP